ncbi:MAG: transcriptional repressor LexA, partial [Acidimicrobiia bacterium]
MSQISDRQRQVLDFIRATVAERGYPPSVREIGEAIGLSSPSTVHSHLSALVAAGVIRRDPTKPRAIEILEDTPRPAPERDDMRDVPLVGRIAAGSPVLAVEDVEDVFSLPEALVGSGPLFMLRVKGDSMVDAGILDGDLVVVRRQPDAADGEIVAAMVADEEATVKRVFRRDGEVI